MNAGHVFQFPSPDEPEPRSIEHILYRVNELLPDDQHVLTVSPETLASDALRLMKKHGFSQLPVEQYGEVIGVFSYRSFADGVLELEKESRLHAEQLPVFDFLEQLSFTDVSTDIGEILDRLDLDNAVLVGSSASLVGIATPMDALRYFYRLTSAFLLLREIERAIRLLLQQGFSDTELFLAVARSSPTKPQENSLPSRIEDLSFGDYVNVIGNRENWTQLQPVFGTSRELVIAKLKPINRLRNDAFHFRRELLEDDYDRLIATRSWLRLRLKVAPRGEESK